MASIHATALVDPAADTGVLALGVLANDDPVQIGRPAALQRLH